MTRKISTNTKLKGRRTRPARARAKPKKRRKLQKFKGKAFVISGRVVGYKGKRKGDPIDFQISAKMKIPKGHTVAAPVLTGAIRHRLATGRNPPGIQLRIIAWRNPDRSDPELAKWRRPSHRMVKDNVVAMLGTNRAKRMSPQQAAWVTLSNMLAKIEVESITVRNSRAQGG